VLVLILKKVLVLVLALKKVLLGSMNNFKHKTRHKQDISNYRLKLCDEQLRERGDKKSKIAEEKNKQ